MGVAPRLLSGLTNGLFGHLLTVVDCNSFAAKDYVRRTSLGEQIIEISMRE
jgi:hypothetical protein